MSVAAEAGLSSTALKAVGENTDQVMAEVLGKSTDDIAALRDGVGGFLGLGRDGRERGGRDGNEEVGSHGGRTPAAPNPYARSWKSRKPRWECWLWPGMRAPPRFRADSVSDRPGSRPSP